MPLSSLDGCSRYHKTQIKIHSSFASSIDLLLLRLVSSWLGCTESKKTIGVECMTNEPNSQKDTSLVFDMRDLHSLAVMDRQVEEGGSNQGREHGRSKSSLLDRVKTLAHGEEGSTATGNGTTTKRE